MQINMHYVYFEDFYEKTTRNLKLMYHLNIKYYPIHTIYLKKQHKFSIYNELPKHDSINFNTSISSSRNKIPLHWDQIAHKEYFDVTKSNKIKRKPHEKL